MNVMPGITTSLNLEGKELHGKFNKKIYIK